MVKIVRFEETGAPEVLRLFDEPLVAPGEGQIRLKVQAIGLNRAEIMLREGRYAADPVLPSRIGLEASGTIDAIGAGVSGFSIGDFVSAVPFLTWDKWGNWTQESLVKYGVYGESAMVPADTVAHNPANLSAEEGAAIWCQYLTAWGGLVDFAGVTSNDIVLVTAGSSSAALGALQIAKAEGATVIGQTRTAAKRDFLREAGADCVVVTDEEDLAEQVMTFTGGRGFTVCYDPIGGKFCNDLIAAAQPGGKIINYGNLNTGPVDFPILPILSKRLHFKCHSVFDTMRMPDRRAAGFAYIRDKVNSGALKVIIDSTFPLNRIAEAHRHMESNQQRGKIVVTA